VREQSDSLGRSGWVIVSALMLSTVLANIGSVCMFPQIVALSEEFGRPANQVVWTMTAFHVVAAGVGGVAAALGAVLGNRRMLTVTLVLLFPGSLLAALANGLTVLIAGRVLQGESMAIQALAIGIITNYWRGEARRRALSMIVLAMGLGAVSAYLLLGMLFGLAGFGLAFAHGSLWLTLLWLAALGVPGALAGSASYAVSADAVPSDQGIMISTIYNTAANTGVSISSAVVGYVLSVRQVAATVTGAGGSETQFFPAEQAFT